MLTITSWLQMQTILLLRRGPDLGPVLGSDARLPCPARCDLCGDEPVLRGRLVRLGGVPVVRESAGLISFWTEPIASERASNYRRLARRRLRRSRLPGSRAGINWRAMRCVMAR